MKCIHLGLHYLSLTTANFDEMLEFYTKEIGLDALSYENDMVYLGIQQERKVLLLLVAEEKEQMATEIRRSLVNIGFSMANIDALVQLKTKLEQDAYICSALKEKVGDVYFSTHDPDGNYLVFTVDPNLSQTIALNHIGLQVGHLKETLHLYQDIFQLQIQEQPTMYYIGTAKQLPLLTLQKKENKDMKNHLDFIAFCVPTMQEVDALHQAIQALGWKCYYNKGKRILQFLDQNSISYWIQADES